MSKQQHHNAGAHEYVIEFTKQSTKFFRKEEIGVVFCDRRHSYSRLVPLHTLQRLFDKTTPTELCDCRFLQSL